MTNRNATKKTKMMMNFAALSLSTTHQYYLEDDNEPGWLIIVFCGIYTK
jgi:hypothetical protein